MADTVMKFGKHNGDSFVEVRTNDEGYCKWVRELTGVKGQMLDFQDYLSEFPAPRRRRRRNREEEPIKEKKPRKAVEGPDFADVKHDTEADEEKGEECCIICLTNRRCCVTLPCLHLSYCITCARRLVFGETGMELKYRGEVSCPQCRDSVKRIKRVHL